MKAVLWFCHRCQAGWVDAEERGDVYCPSCRVADPENHARLLGGLRALLADVPDALLESIPQSSEHDRVLYHNAVQ
jgi:hypothetical protein